MQHLIERQEGTLSKEQAHDLTNIYLDAVECHLTLALYRYKNNDMPGHFKQGDVVTIMIELNHAYDAVVRRSLRPMVSSFRLRENHRFDELVGKVGRKRVGAALREIETLLRVAIAGSKVLDDVIPVMHQKIKSVNEVGKALIHREIERLYSRTETSIEKIERSVRNDRPDVRKASAPDGTVTIVFSDIESSTTLLERLGDTEFVRMLGWHDRLVRDTTEEHRGFVVKSQGDGFMLAFPSASFALRASLVIRDRIAEGFGDLPVRIRAGLHSGEAIKRDDDFYGRTVVIAARISALALGGEVLASDLVYALARGLGTFTFGTPRTAKFKGLQGSFELYPVLG